MDMQNMPVRLLAHLRPPIPPLTDDVIEHRKYMKAVSKYHLNISLSIFALIGVAAWASSPVGFARSSIVEAKIEEKLTPVKKDLNELQGQTKQVSEAQAANAKLLRASLGNSVASEIRFFQSKVCLPKIDMHEKETFMREIDRKQNEYRELIGNEYSVPGCNRL